MAHNYVFPLVIQCSQSDARDAMCAFMANLHDLSSFLSLSNALSRQYLHVVVWDDTGREIFIYDNR